MSVQFVVPQSSTDSLGDALSSVFASERATRLQMFPIVRDLIDQPDALASDGCRSAAAWIAMRLGLSYRSALEFPHRTGHPRSGIIAVKGMSNGKQSRSQV